jgi:hypothetical protein
MLMVLLIPLKLYAELLELLISVVKPAPLTTPWLLFELRSLALPQKEYKALIPVCNGEGKNPQEFEFTDSVLVSPKQIEDSVAVIVQSDICPKLGIAALALNKKHLTNFCRVVFIYLGVKKKSKENNFTPKKQIKPLITIYLLTFVGFDLLPCLHSFSFFAFKPIQAPLQTRITNTIKFCAVRFLIYHE